jgi:hypothetical protein
VHTPPMTSRRSLLVAAMLLFLLAGLVVGHTGFLRLIGSSTGARFC